MGDTTFQFDSRLECGSGSAASAFRQTNWSMLFSARGNGQSSVDALNELCRAYWEPVYTVVRRWNHPHHKAEDLTQGFFVHFLSIFPTLELEPAKGRFRSLLLAVLLNFLRKDWTRVTRPEAAVSSWDLLQDEQQGHPESRTDAESARE